MDWLLRDIPSCQMEEAMAFYRVEPFGDDWKQAAKIASICSMASTNTKYARAIPESDIIPKFEDPEEQPEQTEEQFNASLAAMQHQMALMGMR